MLVQVPQVGEDADGITYSSVIRFDSGEEFGLFFNVLPEFGHMVSRRVDAAAVTALVPAMERGEQLILEGTVTDELLHALNGDFQEVIKNVIPRLTKVKVTATDAAPPGPRRSGVAAGFSAGVDSYSAISEYYLADKIPDSLRLSHLLFNNVGAHERGGRMVFKNRLARASAASRKLGLPLVVVDSNAEKLYGGFGFVQTHTFRNAAVAFLLQSGVGTFLYASGFPYSEVKVSPSYGSAYSDAVSLPTISTSSLTLRSVGSSLTRVEKTLQAVSIPVSYETLDVCTSSAVHAVNCSTCNKCMRTQLTLDIAGALELYQRVFHLPAYRKGRARFLGRVIAEPQPMIREIKSFARARKYRIPKSAYLYAVPFVLKDFAIRIRKPIRMALRSLGRV